MDILGINHQCPKCKIEYKPHYTTKERARNSRNLVEHLMKTDKRTERVEYYKSKYKHELVYFEQYCSGICSDRCWKKCSPEELVQYKYITPLTLSAKHVYTDKGREIHPITRV
jgi:hypothetical protein